MSFEPKKNQADRTIAAQSTRPPTVRHLDPVEFDAPEVSSLPHRSTMHWPRKIFHMLGIGSVGLSLAFSSVTTAQALVILGAIAAIIIPLDILRRFVPRLNDKVFKDFGFIMRDYERRKLSGMSWFLMAMVLTLAFSPRAVAGLAALLLAFGDPWASVIGLRYGRTRLFGGQKTLEGLLGAFGVCLVVSLFYLSFAGLVSTSMILPAAALAALAGAIAESLPIKKLDDNFTVPLLTAPILMGVVALLG